MKIKNEQDKYIDLHDLMIEKGASDLYLTYGEHPTLRINNQLFKVDQLPQMDDDMLNEIRSNLVKPEYAEYFTKNLSLDRGISHNGRRFRINISKQQGHIMVVSRLLMDTPPSIDELGLPPIFKELASKTSGIILIAGPTGSGKSTTLASILQEINTNYSKHIITIEDPIEYKFKPAKSIIEQKELGKDIVSFSGSLKYTLRQRPDVILFGEIRDLDGIRNALLLAETGHLLLASIHARSSIQTINKIIGSFPSEQQNQIRTQLSENLIAIVSQKLLRTKNNKSMFAVQEIMINNTAVSNIIRENKMNMLNNTISTNKKYGMQLLEEELIDLVAGDKINISEAIDNANDPIYLQKELINRGILKN
ncbi:PilT/PilU family type 4a pilus ATPase [Candidatus Gracilibacteria bacterium]|nr:PilT/PilU family type 4a pilus ATPase [Candidatus Gracilibacteria bacterium]